MNRLTSGMIAGGIVGAIGASYLMMDKRSRSKAIRESKRLIRKSKDMLRDMDIM